MDPDTVLLVAEAGDFFGDRQHIAAEFGLKEASVQQAADNQFPHPTALVMGVPNRRVPSTSTLPPKADINCLNVRS